jgi:hypothetical protein
MSWHLTIERMQFPIPMVSASPYSKHTTLWTSLLIVADQDIYSRMSLLIAADWDVDAKKHPLPDGH